MHGSPCAGHQQHSICGNPSSSSSSPTTISRVDTSCTPHLPHTPPLPAIVEEVPLLSKTLWMPPVAPIPPTSMTIDTHRARIIQQAHNKPSSTSEKRASDGGLQIQWMGQCTNTPSLPIGKYNTLW